MGQMRCIVIGREAPAALDRILEVQARGDHPSFETHLGACCSQPQGLLCQGFGDYLSAHCPGHQQDKRVCCPQPALWQAGFFTFWAEHHGGGGHPLLLVGAMDWQAVAIWRVVFALG